MATSSEQAPPPPYEANSQQAAQSRSVIHQCTTRESDGDQTVPKSYNLDRPTTQSNMTPENVDKSRLKSQLDTINKHHTCVPGSRKGSNADQQRAQFINSLSAPRKFLSYITIEPFAFLSILAVYIEFPSIQDLIYTKICLQVVANHSNFSSPLLVPTIEPLNLTLSQSNFTHVTTSKPFGSIFLEPLSDEGMRNLSDSGRIQQPTTTVMPINIPKFTNEQSDREHILCDRLNRTAIPREMRQEIVDLDSLFWLKYQVLTGLLCAISSPYWGGISDRIGRLIPLNVPIVLSIACNLVSLIFGSLISLNSHTLFKLEWLYLGSVLIGISGGQAAIIVNSFSFISDNTSSQSRSTRVVVLESVIYLSHSVGFYISKHIMSISLVPDEMAWLNRHFVAFSLCIILNLVCVLYSIFKLRHYKFHRFLNNFEREQQEAFAGELSSSTSTITGGNLNRVDTLNDVNSNLPEIGANVSNTERTLRELTSSTPDDLDGPVARADKSWKSDWGVILTLQYYKQTYLTATKRRESRTIILLLLLSGIISALSLACLMSLLYIYVRMDPFNWDTKQYSLWNTVTSTSKVFALISLTLSMKFVKAWNVPDPLVAAIGFLSKGTGLLMIALAQSSVIINWSLLAFVVSEFSMPPIRSLLSKLVIKEEVGKIYSCLAALQSICFLFGNIVFYLAYTSLELQNFFRLSFLVVSAAQFGAVIIMLMIYTTLRQRVMIV